MFSKVSTKRAFVIQKYFKGSVIGVPEAQDGR